MFSKLIILVIFAANASALTPTTNHANPSAPRTQTGAQAKATVSRTPPPAPPASQQGHAKPLNQPSHVTQHSMTPTLKPGSAIASPTKAATPKPGSPTAPLTTAPAPLSGNSVAITTTASTSTPVPTTTEMSIDIQVFNLSSKNSSEIEDTMAPEKFYADTTTDIPIPDTTEETITIAKTPKCRDCTSTGASFNTEATEVNIPTAPSSVVPEFLEIRENCPKGLIVKTIPRGFFGGQW